MTEHTSRPDDHGHAADGAAPGRDRAGEQLLARRRAPRPSATPCGAGSDRLRSGDPGALPSVLGLLVLGVIFSQVSARFLQPNNIGNLPGQGAYIAIIAMGLVFVLLLGEIDLSAGTTGGMCAGFAAQAIFSGGLHHGMPGPASTGS